MDNCGKNYPPSKYICTTIEKGNDGVSYLFHRLHTYQGHNVRSFGDELHPYFPAIEEPRLIGKDLAEPC
jgi:hypothetical protein